MAHIRAAPRRGVQRCYERNRLEDELWTTVYETIWPVVRRALQRRLGPPRRQVRGDGQQPLARRA
jgi:hypothetical protein